MTAELRLRTIKSALRHGALGCEQRPSVRIWGVSSLYPYFSFSARWNPLFAELVLADVGLPSRLQRVSVRCSDGDCDLSWIPTNFVTRVYGCNNMKEKAGRVL